MKRTSTEGKLSRAEKGGAVDTNRIPPVFGASRFMRAMLAIALVVSLIPVAAFASEEKPQISASTESVVDESSANNKPIVKEGPEATIENSGSLGVLTTPGIDRIANLEATVENPESLEVLAAPTIDRIADEVVIDKSADKFDIAVLDANLIQSVILKDGDNEEALLPRNAGDTLVEGEQAQWSIKDSNKLVLSDEFVASLEIKEYTLKLMYTDGEEEVKLAIRDVAVASTDNEAAKGITGNKDGELNGATVPFKGALLNPLSTSFMSFDGKDTSSTGNTWIYTNAAMYETGVLLDVYTSFTPNGGGNTSTNRVLEISFEKGLYPDTLPGFKYNASTHKYEFNKDNFPSGSTLADIIDSAYYVQDEPFALSNESAQPSYMYPRTGRVVYLFKDAAGPATISIGVKMQNVFLANGNESRTLTDTIKAKTTETLNGTANTIVDEGGLNAVTLTGAANLFLYMDTKQQEPQNKYAVPGQTDMSFSWSILTRIQNLAANSTPIYIPKGSFVVSLPSGLVLPEDIAEVVTFPASSLLSANNTSWRVLQRDGVDGQVGSKVEITVENVVPSSYNLSYTVNFSIADKTAFDTLPKDLLIKTTDRTIWTYGDDASISGSSGGAASVRTVHVLEDEEPLISFKDLTQMPAYVAPSDMDSGDMTYMGGFYLLNETVNNIDLLGVKLSYTDNGARIRVATLP